MRIGDAKHPGPPRGGGGRRAWNKTIATGLVMWMANGDGITSKLPRVWAAARAAEASVVCVVETHIDDDRGLRRDAKENGFAACLTSSRCRRSCGVALCGPEHLRADPHRWGKEWQGRIVSGILHTKKAEILVVGAYFDVDDADARGRMAQEIADRRALARRQAAQEKLAAAEKEAEKLAARLQALEASDGDAATSEEPRSEASHGGGAVLWNLSSLVFRRNRRMRRRARVK